METSQELIVEARAFASSSPLGKPLPRQLDKAILMIRRLADTLEAVGITVGEPVRNPDRLEVDEAKLAEAIGRGIHFSGYADSQKSISENVARVVAEHLRGDGRRVSASLRGTRTSRPPLLSPP